MLTAMPMKPTPMVPAVVHELPIEDEITAQTTAVVR